MFGEGSPKSCEIFHLEYTSRNLSHETMAQNLALMGKAVVSGIGLDVFMFKVL